MGSSTLQSSQHWGRPLYSLPGAGVVRFTFFPALGSSIFSVFPALGSSILQSSRHWGRPLYILPGTGVVHFTFFPALGSPILQSSRHWGRPLYILSSTGVVHFTFFPALVTKTATTQPKPNKCLSSIYHCSPFYCSLSVVSFCSLIKGITSTICMLCFALINSVLFNLSCVWISSTLLVRSSRGV